MTPRQHEEMAEATKRQREIVIALMRAYGIEEPEQLVIDPPKSYVERIRAGED